MFFQSSGIPVDHIPGVDVSRKRTVRYPTQPFPTRLDRCAHVWCAGRQRDNGVARLMVRGAVRAAKSRRRPFTNGSFMRWCAKSDDAIPIGDGTT
jgi:hypothetical protein